MSTDNAVGIDDATLAQEEAELRRLVDEKERLRTEEQRARSRLGEIQQEKARRSEEAARRTAVERIKGISRAAGGVAASYAEAEEGVAAAAAALAAAVKRANGLYDQLLVLGAESDALIDRFDVKAAKVPTPMPPYVSERIVAAMRQVNALNFVQRRSIDPAEERCEHRMRVRRSYLEVAGTDAHRIITDAGGPKPFPPLTERQKRMIDERQLAREAELRSAHEVTQLARETTARLAIAPGGVRSV